MQSFKVWIKRQKNREDRVGDISRDILQDGDFPAKADLATMVHYLTDHEAVDLAIESLRAAWEEYKNDGQSNI